MVSSSVLFLFYLRFIVFIPFFIIFRQTEAYDQRR